jgi:putative transposase
MERKEVVLEYVGLGLKLLDALDIAEMSKHQYYYKSSVGTKGRKPTNITKLLSNNSELNVDDTEVVKRIVELWSDPDLRYGYIKMTHALKQDGFLINKKKVFRLMQAEQLLQIKSKSKGKTYVRYRVFVPPGPLQLLAMDIKMIWIERDRKHAYILTIIDAFTRMVLCHTISFSIKQQQVKQVLTDLIINHLQVHDCLNRKINIELRNDNDKRFSAKMVRSFLKENNLNQVFTHPYTPQDNGYIESFHSILTTRINNRKYWSIQELIIDIDAYYLKYNNVRIHHSCSSMAPSKFWSAYATGNYALSCSMKNRTLKLHKINDLLANGSQSEESGKIDISCKDTFELNDIGQLALPNVKSNEPPYKRSPSLESGMQNSNNNTNIVTIK